MLLWDFVLVDPDLLIHPVKQETSGVGRNDLYNPRQNILGLRHFW